MVFNYAKELKLPVLRDELDDFITFATDENGSLRTLICRLPAREMELRIENHRKQHLRIAGFPGLKYLQELVREELPKDVQTALPELETLEFIKEGRNIVFCGNPGTGKTHLSIGLGIKACLEDYTVCFTSVPYLCLLRDKGMSVTEESQLARITLPDV
jgi:DNA replication protein DnaC